MNKNRLWSNETFVRIVSLLIAIILWMYVVSVDNPKIDTTIRNIPIQVVNIGNVQNNGLEIISMSDEKIDVKISGRMSDVSNITSESISVLLDVSNIYSANNYYIKPDVKINANGVSVTGISINSVNVYVDYISRVEKEIIMETVGEPKEGYSVVSLDSANSKVIVSGPQGIINRIDKVKAIVDVSDASKDISSVCEIKLFSSNGDEIVSDKVKLSESAISVSVKLVYSKKVPVEVDLRDISGFNIDKYNVVVSVSEVEIMGEEEILKPVSGITAKLENFSYEDEDSIILNEWKTTLIIPEKITLKDDINEVIVKFERK